jgi:FkbM family methyltransferase
MNKLLKHKEAFSSGEIDKATFVQEMYNEHAILFSYPSCLKNVNISEIKIREDGVTVEFKEPSIFMICPFGDMRIAPIEAFNFGDYEHDEIQIVRRIVERLGGASVRFFDIGANAGFYSLALSAYFPRITGIAFEPVPTTFSYLQKNLEINGIRDVEALNLGLSNKQDELIFFTYPSQSGASSMTRNVDSSDVQEVRCKVVRLDDHDAALGGKVGFIKCDVEGAELYVFQGAEQTLRRDLPVVFTEMLRKWCAKYDYHPNDIITFFGTLGYCAFIMHGNQLQPCMTVTTETMETNFLFLHLERHAALISEFS